MLIPRKDTNMAKTLTNLGIKQFLDENTIVVLDSDKRLV